MPDNQADRRRRTVEAPNGARVVLPYGTSDKEVFDTLLRYCFVDFPSTLLPLETPFAHMPRQYRGEAHYFEVWLG